MKVTNDLDHDFTRDFNQDFDQDFAQDSNKDIEQELDQNYGQEEKNILQNEREVDTSESDLSAEETSRIKELRLGISKITYSYFTYVLCCMQEEMTTLKSFK